MERLPGAMKEEQLEDGSVLRRCIYTPILYGRPRQLLYSMATSNIVKVQHLLGHRYITTPQIYDKRRRSTSESASHLLAI